LKRIVRVLAIAVFIVTILVIVSAPAFARPRFGGVQVSPVACQMFADGPALFEWRSGGEVCWFTPPGL
jgi:hypothetical protein